jgi:hypothetical protein
MNNKFKRNSARTRSDVDAFISRPNLYLSDDLRRPPWKGHPNPLAGHCYVASEALYWLLPVSEGNEWKPEQIQHEGSSHWYLRNKASGAILDVTAAQFDTPVPYHLGRGRGFLTRGPSKRAAILICRVLNGTGAAVQAAHECITC